jgi:small GTP-binding protein
MTILYKVKTVMIGEAGSGKSCIIHRLIFNSYNEFGNATIGAQFLTKEIGDYKLEIWDTAGQERYRALIPMYLRNASIVCLVISVDKNKDEITNEKQFWLNYLERNNSMSKYHKKVLIYNKADLNPDFIMEPDERFDFSILLSCKTNAGIDEFTRSLDNIVINLENTFTIKPPEIPTNIKIEEEQEPVKNEKQGLLDYTYSLSREVMKCSLL